MGETALSIRCVGRGSLDRRRQVRRYDGMSLLLSGLPGLIVSGLAVASEVDTAASDLYVRVFKDPSTIAAGLAHDHVVLATGWSGRVALDAPGGCVIDIRVPVEGLVADPPEWRRRLGLEGELSERQRRSIRASMRGEDQLAASRFPEIAFVATGCASTGAGLEVAGDLTIRGVTRAIHVPMTVSRSADGLRAQGTFSARATEFGFEPFRAFGGAVRNLDEMTFVIDVSAPEG